MSSFPMADTKDQLIEVSHGDWAELRDLFRRDWPKHEFAFHLLQNYVQWKDQDESIDVKIFSLNENWRDDETFLLKDAFEIYFYSSETDENNLHLVRLLTLLEWETLHEISMDYLERHHLAVARVISNRSLSVTSSNLANYYFMAKEKALAQASSPLPEGFAFARLALKNLDYVYKQWPLRNHISYEAGFGLLKRLILLNESVGLFNGHGVLVSWCLSDQTGAHSDLQTVEAECRNGYGRLVAKELARRLARKGSDSKAYVLQENEKSIKLFESIGFDRIQNLHWVVIGGSTKL
uniref:GCN5-related N-acetyltransferase Rv2170-like domain-containing protein n=1 Tax=Anopheles atroparvus TaxID=41427 RepID=A0AAG5DR56_ANOAO